MALAVKMTLFLTQYFSPFQCFFPQNVISNIKTPLFLLNAAYDSLAGKDFHLYQCQILSLIFLSFVFHFLSFYLFKIFFLWRTWIVKEKEKTAATAVPPISCFFSFLFIFMENSMVLQCLVGTLLMFSVLVNLKKGKEKKTRKIKGKDLKRKGKKKIWVKLKMSVVALRLSIAVACLVRCHHPYDSSNEPKKLKTRG